MHGIEIKHMLIELVKLRNKNKEKKEHTNPEAGVQQVCKDKQEKSRRILPNRQLKRYLKIATSLKEI